VSRQLTFQMLIKDLLDKRLLVSLSKPNDRNQNNRENTIAKHPSKTFQFVLPPNAVF